LVWEKDLGMARAPTRGQHVSATKLAAEPPEN